MEHGKTGKQNNSPTKHVTLLVSMGLCASASMYICAIFLSPAAEEEEAEGDAACFCEEADGERCCAAAALLDAAADDEGVVELVATLRDETELIVTGRRLPGELCAPLRPLRTALIQGWWWWWGGGGSGRETGFRACAPGKEPRGPAVFFSRPHFYFLDVEKERSESSCIVRRRGPQGGLPKKGKRKMVRASFNQDSSCLALADRRGIRVWSLGRGTVVFEESLGGVR